MTTRDNERGANRPNDEVTRHGLEALVAKIHAPGWGALRTGVIVRRTWRLVQSLGSGSFTNETRVMASLQGEHLVRVYDCGEHEGLPFFVMERLLGQSLEARLERDGALEWEAFCCIALGILRALVEAHAHGVVHRDIKPANIMILKGERVKLLDFGLAMTIEHVEAGSTSEPSSAADRHVDGHGSIDATCIRAATISAAGSSGSSTDRHAT